MLRRIPVNATKIFQDQKRNVMVAFVVNGQRKELAVAADTSLLWVLRELCASEIRSDIDGGNRRGNLTT